MQLDIGPRFASVRSAVEVLSSGIGIQTSPAHGAYEGSVDYVLVALWGPFSSSL